MTTDTPELISYGRRVQCWAETYPDKAALIFVPEDGPTSEFSWRILDRRSNQIARLLAHHGVDDDSMVVIGVQNQPEYFFVALAAWKLGAMTLPLRRVMPQIERDQVLHLGQPKVVVADWENVPYPTLTTADLAQADDLADDPLPDIIAHPGKSNVSGGSTGRSKIIVDPNPWGRTDESLLNEPMGVKHGQVQLVLGPLYHAAPFVWAFWGMFEAHTLVLMERFDAARAVGLIEQYRVNYVYMAPVHMSRIAKLPNVSARDFSSVTCLLHMAAPCPPWLKRTWFDLVGPEHVLELLAMTESVGMTMIWGDEWLTHPGSVGKAAIISEVKILDATGNEAPRGEVGEIFMRRLDKPVTYEYVGSPALKTSPDGFASVGDLGWMDEDGYVYIADRRVDMIITGGANVFPAEVEAALSGHPDVADIAVIGLLDDEWGRRVHAVVQPRQFDSPPDIQTLNLRCREHLMSYKVPKSYDFVEELPRNNAGKLRRSALIQERESGQISMIQFVSSQSS